MDERMSGVELAAQAIIRLFAASTDYGYWTVEYVRSTGTLTTVILKHGTQAVVVKIGTEGVPNGQTQRSE